MKFVLFSMRNFERDGGGSIRMYGILNALAKKGHEVYFISNAKNLTKFHPSIKHVNIGYEFHDKRKFQGLLGILPAGIVYALYPKLFNKIEEAIQKVDLHNSRLIFCEYLDNSIGYVLKKKNKIHTYINDQHGIATIEFRYQRDNSKNLLSRIFFHLKYKLSDFLDEKVFGYADGLIFASEAMKSYYQGMYKKTHDTKSFILPYLLGDDSQNEEIDIKQQNEICRKYEIFDDEFVVFFAGGYKPTAGVEDLIDAFSKFCEKKNKYRLILIGNGPSQNQCKEKVKNLELENKVLFIDKIPYEHLRTFQSVADLVVCPDRQNPYSDLIIHLKYLDSLRSNKIVINGGFQSVLEINPNEEISLNFIPSDVESLFQKMKYAKNNYSDLQKKYSKNFDFVKNNLVYESCIQILSE